MKCGDIIGLVTNQAENHNKKYKYHLCICVRDNLFLFINTSGNREGSFTITQKDWQQMPKPRSFISCDKLIKYTPQKLTAATPKGHLETKSLERLMDHISDSEILTGAEIDLVIDAFSQHLGG